MTPRRLGILAFAILSLVVDAAPRRRAVQTPGLDPNTLTPNEWLLANSHVLNTVDLVPDSSDLQPLRSMIGSAEVVGIGDGTHGTHEFYTAKHRVVDFLVREMNFDVLGFEAPYALMNRINAYVQGGPGDARALLSEMHDLTYFFWDAEEILALLEWAREYNAHRGDRPALQIAGFDVTNPGPPSQAVVEYLRTVDPAASVDAETKYECARAAQLVIDNACETRAMQVRNALIARETELIALSSANAYAEALQNARIVVQSRWGFGNNRDEGMTHNALWLRDHRSSTGKMIVWAHGAHVSEAEHEFLDHPMGQRLSDALGPDYFSINTMTAAGSYLQWTDPARNGNFITVVRTFPAPPAGSYESYLRLRGVPALLVPLNKPMPTWLSTATTYYSAGVNGGPTVHGSLPAQYDAILFIDTTSAMRPN